MISLHRARHVFDSGLYLTFTAKFMPPALPLHLSRGERMESGSWMYADVFTWVDMGEVSTCVKGVGGGLLRVLPWRARPVPLDEDPSATTGPGMGPRSSSTFKRRFSGIEN